MSDIDTVLDNILEYRNDIDSLVRQLKALGINSLEEFKQAAKESGAAVPASIQAAVEQKFANSDEDDWNEARGLNTEEAYLGYLNAHSDGAYATKRAVQSQDYKRLQQTERLMQSGRISIK